MYYMAYLNIKDTAFPLRRRSVCSGETPAVITGGAHGIGRVTAEEFRRNGADVCVIDIRSNPYFTGDIADEDTLERFSEKVIGGYGHVDFLMNNAMPL